MFVDRVKITVKGGDGGNGCCSFRREKFVPKGGPDGGDGGAGGSIYIESTSSEQSLVALVYQSHFRGANGPGGKGAGCHGRNAEPVTVKVPVGTVVTDAESGEIIADLDAPGMRVLVAKGGRGGRGNARFVSSVNRVPRYCEEGKPGEERSCQLELKTIADVGLVGFPNAGKSTLLGAISAAKPKVASYPFTTLNPVVGVVDYPDYERILVADIPGLIEGAHENIGLGHAFLRHIERTSVLCYVLDMGGVDGRDPLEDLDALKKELELYMPGLSKRATMIVANKMDLEGAEENFKRLQEKMASEVIAIYPATAAIGELAGVTAGLREQVTAAKKAGFYLNK